MNRLSYKANEVLSIFTKENIVYVREILSHDGYNSFGPESDLWDLYLIIKENDDYIYYHYRWENWFLKEIEDDYEVYQETKLSETILENILLFHKKTKDTFFKEAVKKQFEKIKIEFFQQK